MCIFILGLFFARQLWRRGLTTLGDLYVQRFGSGVSQLAVIVMVPTSVIWAAAQIRAFGQVLSANSQLTVDYASGFAALIVIAYTVLGGLLADVVSDLVQGVVLIAGLLILCVTVLFNVPESADLASALTPERLALRADGESWLSVIDGWSIPFIGSLFAAELVSRMLAARSPGVAVGGALTGGLIYLLIGLLPLSLGLLGPALIPGLENGEQILPLLALQYLPNWLYVIFIGALVSAILSTVDSALLNAGSLVSHNLVLPYLPGTDEHHKVRYARLAVFSFGIIAYVLAVNADSVYGLVEESSAFGSAGIFTCCLMGLTQRRVGRVTATATILVGMLSYGTLAYLTQVEYAYLISLLSALITFLTLMWFEPGAVNSGRSVPNRITVLQ
ncbi:MAG: sodium:solute symporter [Gammaproteobacteria bacterium]|nr:hypothetical protein [Pseudomonadales bacterium]